MRRCVGTAVALPSRWSADKRGNSATAPQHALGWQLYCHPGGDSATVAPTDRRKAGCKPAPRGIGREKIAMSMTPKAADADGAGRRHARPAAGDHALPHAPIPPESMGGMSEDEFFDPAAGTRSPTRRRTGPTRAAASITTPDRLSRASWKAGGSPPTSGGCMRSRSPAGRSPPPAAASSRPRARWAWCWSPTPTRPGSSSRW